MWLFRFNFFVFLISFSFAELHISRYTIHSLTTRPSYISRVTTDVGWRLQSLYLRQVFTTFIIGSITLPIGAPPTTPLTEFPTTLPTIIPTPQIPGTALGTSPYVPTSLPPLNTGLPTTTPSWSTLTAETSSTGTDNLLAPSDPASSIEHGSRTTMVATIASSGVLITPNTIAASRSGTIASTVSSSAPSSLGIFTAASASTPLAMANPTTDSAANKFISGSSTVMPVISPDGSVRAGQARSTVAENTLTSITDEGGKVSVLGTNVMTFTTSIFTDAAGSVRTTFVAQSTASSTSTPASNMSSAYSLSTGAKAGIGAGVAVGALTLVTSAIFLIVRKKRGIYRGPSASKSNGHRDERNSIVRKAELESDPVSIHRRKAVAGLEVVVKPELITKANVHELAWDAVSIAPLSPWSPDEKHESQQFDDIEVLLSPTQPMGFC